jgi:hypothetical protein
MRIRKVTAHAFGPLVNDTLELADGMTVVVGVNESAKSSWHAAIYAAVCGRRRGRGSPTRDERRFIELHKPWDGGDWLVTSEVVLDDGRRIELRHDLAGKVDCHAKDLDVGDDISNTVMNEGAPDGALWLGLDRTSFVATACVEQTQLLGVLTNADGLQEHLQRAAATAGTDATAAAALELLRDFQRDRVGLDRANSSKPLRTALVDVNRTSSSRMTAQEAHTEYLSRLQQVEELHETATVARRTLATHEAAAAAHVAAGLAERQHEAEELNANFAGGRPADLTGDDATAHEVSQALAAWRSAPAPGVAQERSSADIERDIQALPPVPDGDTTVHGSVQEADECVARADAQFQQHDRNRPGEETSTAAAVAAGDDELLDLARTLETPVPIVPPDLVEREQAARLAATAPAQRPLPVPLLIAAAVVAVIGVVLVATGQPVVGAVVALAGVVFGAVVFAGRHPASVDGATVSALATAQAALAAGRQQSDAAQQRQDRAVARCFELGLPPDPQALRDVPVARARTQGQAEDLRRWTRERESLVRELDAAVGALSGALAGRGHRTTGTNVVELRAAARAYRVACEQRAEQAAAASRHTDLAAQLTAARGAEQRAAADSKQRQAAKEKLFAAARSCGAAADTPEQAVELLTEWERERGSRVAQLVDDQNEWSRLQVLLDGRTLDELTDLAAAANEKAVGLAAAVTAAELAAVDPATAADALPALREDAAEARNCAATADGEFRQFSATVPSVSEAEEALDAANDELARVRELEETLQLTTEFLTTAQDRVHRDIAPRLASSVKTWLPKVTAGRYTDVIVNPTTLQVQVQVAGPSGSWRQADCLSYGTAEQIYLLLRVALAEHLTNGHDTCPLLLDDVTVHADATRTRDILDLLLQVSNERQIVLFTQEEMVAAWAREHLTGPDNRLIELPAPTAA